jgi:hypothetical protein
MRALLGPLTITSAPEANSAATNSACGASPNPLVAGVPAAVSGGGGTGFPERPRDGRGRGIDGFFGERAMSRNMALWARRLKSG